jgi:hypothetical protein
MGAFSSRHWSPTFMSSLSTYLNFCNSCQNIALYWKGFVWKLEFKGLNPLKVRKFTWFCCHDIIQLLRFYLCLEFLQTSFGWILYFLLYKKLLVQAWWKSCSHFPSLGNTISALKVHNVMLIVVLCWVILFLTQGLDLFPTKIGYHINM